MGTNCTIKDLIIILMIRTNCFCIFCHIQLQKLEEAIKDCTSAIELDENYLKAYMRRAKW